MTTSQKRVTLLQQRGYTNEEGEVTTIENNRTPSTTRDDTLEEPLVVNNNDSTTGTTRAVFFSSSSLDSNSVLRNFFIMSILFSANHGTIVSCLSLATSRLGALGAWQSGILYICYTLSAVFGGSYVVKEVGGRNGMIVGMLLYCVYVGCFVVATAFPQFAETAALTGAAFGGVGAGFLWIAQGNYFAEAAKHYAATTTATAAATAAGDNNDDNDHDNNINIGKSTSFLAGIFAFLYLLLEVVIRSSSSALVAIGFDWRAIFAIYTAIACATTFGMLFVIDYPKERDNNHSFINKATASVQLLITDPRMKYMIGLNATFGFAGAFLNSYVNGEVLAAALNDTESKYVGLLSSWTALIAAFFSLFTSKISSLRNKGNVLITGAITFFFVAFPFILFPDSTTWTVFGLLLIYTLQGIGRATFESTLKATFAEYFRDNSTGAFGNIILQNGLASAIGYLLTFQLTCDDEASRYCIKYSDGTLHNVLIFELIVCGTAVLAILGYRRASVLHNREIHQTTEPPPALQSSIT